MGSSLRQPLGFRELLFLAGRDAGALLPADPGFTPSAFGNRSCFWGKGINYPAEAGLLTLCPGTGVERERSSCLLRLSGPAAGPEAGGPGRPANCPTFRGRGLFKPPPSF